MKRNKKRCNNYWDQNSRIHFYQTPEDKMNYITALQKTGSSVMMVGDGLNDAGALLQSNVGVAVAENCNNFTPASDAILDAHQLPRLLTFIQLCRINKKIVMTSFIISILYNIIGLYFAVQVCSHHLLQLYLCLPVVSAYC
jgi:Cu+-exporting ATPase